MVRCVVSLVSMAALGVEFMHNSPRSLFWYNVVIMKDISILLWFVIAISGGFVGFLLGGCPGIVIGAIALPVFFVCYLWFAALGDMELFWGE